VKTTALARLVGKLQPKLPHKPNIWTFAVLYGLVLMLEAKHVVLLLELSTEQSSFQKSDFTFVWVSLSFFSDVWPMCTKIFGCSRNSTRTFRLLGAFWKSQKQSWKQQIFMSQLNLLLLHVEPQASSKNTILVFNRLPTKAWRNFCNVLGFWILLVSVPPTLFFGQCALFLIKQKLFEIQQASFSDSSTWE